MNRNFGVVLRQEDVVFALRLWMLGLAVCGLVFGLDALKLLNPVRGSMEHGLWAVDQRVIKLTTTVTKPVTALALVFDRQERIAKLEEQLALAAVDQQKLKELEGQVALLSPMMTNHQEGVKASTLAELYTKDDLMVVGAGELNGVLPGMAVTDKNGALVGRIESVGRYVSRVERVGSADFRIPAQTVSGGAKGMVYFDGGQVVLGEVLQTEQLAVGDVVVTGGVGGELPPGLIIGQVTSLSGNEADVTKAGNLSLLAADAGWVAIW